jgi:hypothetical protein
MLKGGLLPASMPRAVTFGAPLRLRNAEAKERRPDRAAMALVGLSPWTPAA